MRLRLTKIDEYQFLTCFKHGLWGSKSARFKTWREADRLAIIVDKSLAALAEVLAELARPTFRKIGLSEYCRYIPSEDLSELIARVKGFGGHIQPSILDTVAIPLEDEEDQESP